MPALDDVEDVGEGTGPACGAQEDKVGGHQKSLDQIVDQGGPLALQEKGRVNAAIPDGEVLKVPLNAFECVRMR